MKNSTLEPDDLALLRDAAIETRGRGTWRRGQCPLCGYDKTRDTALSYAPHSGFVMCHRCGARARLEPLDGPPRGRGDGSAEADRRRQLAADILERSIAIEKGSVVDAYLRGRGLHPGAEGWPRDLREALCQSPGRGWWPSMIGVVRDTQGEPMGCSVTFLERRPGGGKAPVIPDRRFYGPVAGGAVRLGPDAVRLVIAEGIESALSASILLGPDAGTPWAALSAGGVAGLRVPRGVQRITIFADHDSNGAGLSAAGDLLSVLDARGIDCRVKMATDADHDANDLLRRGPR